MTSTYTLEQSVRADRQQSSLVSFGDAYSNSTTLLDLLRSRAFQQADMRAYTFLGDGEEEEGQLTYGQLD